MKYRSGFVSNSSSSSFCIMGLIKDDRFDEVNLSQTSLVVQHGISEYYDDTLIGMYPQSMKGDETLNDFMDRIIAEFKKAGVDVSRDELEWHEDGGYDG